MSRISPIVSCFDPMFEQSTARNSAPEWLRSIRRNGIESFRGQGFPSCADEQWRFTDIRPIAVGDYRLPKEDSPPLTTAEIAASAGTDMDSYRMVFVDGRFAPALSRLEGFPESGFLGHRFSHSESRAAERLGKTGSLLQGAFPTLNAAFIDEGAVVEVPAGMELPKPIQLLYVSSGREPMVATFPRNLILIGEDSRAVLVETYLGQGSMGGLTNVVTEVAIGARASLNHVAIQRENARAFHIRNSCILQEEASQYRSTAITLGGSISRNDIQVVLNGEHGDCTLNGLYLGADRQLIDNHTRIDHLAPNCHSWEVYKGILDDRAAGVFNGKIFVHPGAQKTDAKQTNRVLLLTNDAKINTKPELEIFADDVKCTHGATIGKLNEEAAFYLRSRGLSRDQARSILMYAFAGEVLSHVTVPEVRNDIDTVLLAHFG